MALRRTLLFTLVLTSLFLGIPAVSRAQGCAPGMGRAPLNTLTRSERSAGWRLLFDGRTTQGWRGFKQQTVPEGWTVVEGALTRVRDGRDLITREQFRNFELSLEWRVGRGGNSGILYRVTEQGEWTYETGPEMQVLDDVGHPDGASRLTAAGANYGLYPAAEGIAKPAGQWNTARILVNGARVQHWLNGVKIVEYELLSRDWEAKVAGSKFNQWPGYGRAAEGHIALQDLGDLVSFRNIKIRILP